MTIKELTKMINSTWVQQIRVGEKHRFVDISIVEADGRFFVRQYKFGKQSWYDAFLNTPAGAIKVKIMIIPILGVIPNDLDTINQTANKAYLKKMGIVYCFLRLTYNHRKHEASTLELIPNINLAKQQTSNQPSG